MLTVFLLCLLGGLSLNFSPCMLPMLPVKILSAMNMAQYDRKRLLQMSFLHMLGTVTSFLLLAGLVLLVQAFGGFVMWGMHMQNPIFLVILILFLIPMALDSFGILNLNWSFFQGLGALRIRGKFSAFVDGALTAVVASPCCGPPLATAIGLAFALPPILGALAFVAIGIGLALPYSTICLFPGLVSWVPKTGRWCEVIRIIGGCGTVMLIVWLVKLLMGDVL